MFVAGHHSSGKHKLLLLAVERRSAYSERNKVFLKVLETRLVTYPATSG